MQSLEAMSLQRSLIDWRDDWLIECAFVLSRETKILLMDLSTIPINPNPIKWIIKDNEKTKSITITVNDWLKILQNRIINRAWEDLNLIILKSPFKSRIQPESAPEIIKLPIYNEILNAALNESWQKKLPQILWSSSSPSYFIETMWNIEMNRACSSILKGLE